MSHNAFKSLIAAAAALVSLAASAQAYDRIDTLPEIDSRQARQEERIERGYQRGELTRQEVRRLRLGQREIARAEIRAQADGRITRDELRHLHRMLDRADAEIRQLRRDRGARAPG